MRKKIALGCGIVALALSIGLINFNKGPLRSESPNDNITETASVNNSEIQTLSSSVDMIEFSLDQLNSMSEIIAKGKAVEQSYYTAGDQVFSKTKIMVEKVYKGNVKVGDVLNIVEYGGITNEEEYNLKMLEEKTGKKPTEEQKEKARLNKLRILTGGVPYSEVGKSSVYFLRKATTEQFSTQIDSKTYTPIGIQGRFDVKDGNIIERPRDTSNALKELKMTELDLEKIIKK